MPVEELSDFEALWAESMIDSASGAVRIPGGPSLGGVNYQALCDWTSGNAMSVDPRTDSTPRDVLDLLVNKLRGALRDFDVDSNHIFSQSTGITGKEMTNLLGKPVARKTGKFNPRWIIAEVFLQELISKGHVKLYSRNNEIAKALESDIKANLASVIIANETDPRTIIVGGLLTKQHDAHFRLNTEYGWETYIRDHFGVPDGVTGKSPGSLKDKVPVGTTRTMPAPLHEVLATTWARANVNLKQSWNDAQYEIKKILTSEAIKNSTNRVSLDRYYQVFNEQDMGYMADYCLGQVSDLTSKNNFTLIDIVGTPKQWDVEFEPALIRWREHHRARGRVI